MNFSDDPANFDPIAEAMRASDAEVTFFPAESVVRPLAQAPHVITGPRTEKPSHRLMALLYARGVSPRDIATQTNYSVVQVRSILRTPHMRTVIAEFVHQNFDEGPRDLLQSGVVDAIETLKELCTSEKVPASVRRASARDILEMVDLNHARTLSPQDILAGLDQERSTENEQQ